MKLMSKGKKKVNKKDIVVAGKATVDNMDEEKLREWAEFFGMKVYDEGTEDVLKEMETRIANLGDITAIVRYFDKINQEEVTRTLKLMVDRISVLEYIITDKLDIDVEEIKEYTEKYKKEMEEVTQSMKDIMKESAEAEEADGEPS